MNEAKSLHWWATCVLVGGLMTAVSDTHAAPLGFQPPVTASPHRAEERKKQLATHRAPRLFGAPVTIFNVHTHEAIVVSLADPPPLSLLTQLLRDRTSWESKPIAAGCWLSVYNALHAFGGQRVEIVSGFRSDKLNEMLRKKGHKVAKQSEHVEGHAVDFRIVGVGTSTLYRWALINHLGGVGYYPQSGFVHVDIGRKRTWTGE